MSRTVEIKLNVTHRFFLAMRDSGDDYGCTINTRTGEFKFATDRWFDLNGRYLGSKKPMLKGAYYNNGKRVIVK